MKLYQSILILAAAFIIPLGVDKVRKKREASKRTRAVIPKNTIK